MYNIVAFTGRKRSGKDTAASVLVEYDFVHLKFADSLKHMLAELMRIQGAPTEVVRACIDGHMKEEPCPFLNGRTPRHAMQHLGTTWGRNFMGQDFWISIIRNIIVGNPGHQFVISDCRFPNEVSMIKELGGVVYRIERDGIDTSDNHPSEAQVDTLDVHGVITNNSTVQDFQDHITGLFLAPVGNQSAV